MARRKQAVTIKHVAADAGVSLQTVSRVINKEPNVRPQMKDKVQASIDKLGYVPSIAAQRMSGSKSYLLLALNDRERTVEQWRAREGNDWVDQMLYGGMLKSAELGYRMMIELVDTHSDHIERELKSTLASLQPDGVILTPPHSDSPQIIGLLEDANIPFARLGTLGDGSGIAISMDEEGAARIATEYLIEQGHKRVGFVLGPSDYRLSARRFVGWQEAMNHAGLSSEGLTATGDFSRESGETAARELLGQTDRPTAILCSNDQMTLGALNVAKELGLAVPRDLSLISFDNSPIVRFSQPPLTAIDQPIADITALAVERIIAAQSGGPQNSASSIVDAGLVVRGSVAPPAE